MTNEQFTIFMIEFEKLNVRLQTIEEQLKYVMTPINCNPAPSPRYFGNDNIAYCSGNAGGSEDEQFLENYK